MAETIKFSQWSQLDLRTGKILKAEDIEGADKLYKLSVDLGKELGKRRPASSSQISSPVFSEELKAKACFLQPSTKMKAKSSCCSQTEK